MLRCSYAPGAGDDEETWAEGLNAPLFWTSWQDLLLPGAHGLSERIRAVLNREAAKVPGGGAIAAAWGHRGVADFEGTPSDFEQSAMTREATSGAFGTAAPSLSSTSARAEGFAAPTPVTTDRHHPAPQGCHSGDAADVHQLWPGAYVVAAGVTIASRASALALGSGVWAHADVLIDMCSRSLPSLCRHDAGYGENGGAVAPDSAAPMVWGADAAMVHEWQQACSYGCCWTREEQCAGSAAKAVQHTAGTSHARGPCSAPQRACFDRSDAERRRPVLPTGAQHLHVPVAGSKIDRAALEHTLQPIVRAMHESRRAGQGVLLVDEHGAHCCALSHVAVACRVRMQLQRSSDNGPLVPQARILRSVSCSRTCCHVVTNRQTLLPHQARGARPRRRRPAHAAT